MLCESVDLRVRIQKSEYPRLVRCAEHGAVLAFVPDFHGNQISDDPYHVVVAVLSLDVNVGGEQKFSEELLGIRRDSQRTLQAI